MIMKQARGLLMGEAEWLTCLHPKPMMEFLTDGSTPVGPDCPVASVRKLRLFCCACCLMRGTKPETVDGYERIGPPDYDETEARTDLGWAKGWTEKGHGKPTLAERANLLRDIIGNPYRPFRRFRECWSCEGSGSHLGAGPDRGNPKCDTCQGTGKLPALWIAPLLTPQVWTLAEAAYECRATTRAVRGDAGVSGLTGKPIGVTLEVEGNGTLDPERLAILSDALEEAGMQETAILAHLRTPGPHVRGCWALDLVLGKS